MVVDAVPDAGIDRGQLALRVISTLLHRVIGTDRDVRDRADERPVVADVALLDLQFLAAHPELPLGAVFADAIDQETVVANHLGAWLPAFLPEALLGLEVKVIVRLQRRQRAEDLSRDVQDRLAIELTGREDLERVVVQAQHRVILRLGPADIAREVIGAMDRPKPFFPLR